MVQTWQKTLLGVLLVGAVAVAGIALNFTLLRMTQDAHDPVGKLSPRAVFSGSTEPSPPGGTTTIGHDDRPPPGSGTTPHPDGDADD
jgi:hypothetical protein